MATAEIYKIADETAEILVFGPDMLPIKPRDIVVLAISIVVAALRPADFVSSEQHRNTERQQQGGEQVALLAVAQGNNVRIGGRSLDPVIRAVVAVASVAVVLAIGLVV